MFSTCSELTPRAPIPDGGMEQIMQPWTTWQHPKQHPILISIIYERDKWCFILTNIDAVAVYVQLYGNSLHLHFLLVRSMWDNHADREKARKCSMKCYMFLLVPTIKDTLGLVSAINQILTLKIRLWLSHLHRNRKYANFVVLVIK